MNKINYQDALMGLTEFLQELIADKLDVNRRHISVTTIYPEIVAEVDYEDEEMNLDTYYEVKYVERYFNKETKGWEYGEEKTMYWCHTESYADHDFTDVILTEQEFENCTNDGENA